MKKLALCMVAGLLIISTAASAQKDNWVNLRLKLKPGENFLYRISAETRASILSKTSQKNDREETQQVNLDMEYGLECIDVTESETFHVRIGYTKYRMELASVRDGIMRRSRMDERGIRHYEGDTLILEHTWEHISDPIALSIPKLLDTKFLCELDAGGQIIDRGNLEELQKQFPAIDLGQMLWQQVVFPEEAIAIGAEWSNIVEQKQPSMPGSPATRILVNDYRYRLADIKNIDERKCAEIAVTVNSKLKEVEKETVKLQQNTSGAILIDLATGMVYRSDLKLKQQLEFEMNGAMVRGTSTGVIQKKMIVPSEKNGKSTEDD